MNDRKKSVFVNDEVAVQVRDIIQEARRSVILVTPYLELWRHVKTALSVAVKGGIKVTVVLRDKPEVINSQDVVWLSDAGVTVRAAGGLHAKIYLNEHEVRVSSMNLTEPSINNSLEIALRIQDEQVERQVRDYVNNLIWALSTVVINARHRGSATSRQQGVGGFCIRCERPLSLDPDKPLCDDHYKVWAQYSDPNYSEKFCHYCGRPSDVTYSKPLCTDCFQRMNN
ncbi:MAG: hypothetical protein HYY31_07145 [Chloroflexi bacterium]|nr:hypothetical protein [Chloroflexota bacterium]